MTSIIMLSSSCRALMTRLMATLIENAVLEEQIKIAAYKALSTAARKKPKMLSSVWSDYVREGNVDVTTTRAARTKQRRWENVFAYIGEHSLSTPNLARCHT